MKPKPLKLRLIVALGSEYRGPAELNVYTHHTPAAMTSPELDGPLEIPSTMRTGKPRVLFALRRRRVLRPDRSYRRQGVAEGDILLLTDAPEEAIEPLADTILDQLGIEVPPPPDGRFPDPWLIARHPLVVTIIGGLVVGVVLALLFGT